jgi:hypothetical protein
VTSEQWNQTSHVLDYIMAQPTGKQIRESPGVASIRGEVEQPKRKPKKDKKEVPAQQLRMF